MAVGGRSRDAGDGDGGVVAQLADLRAAGRPGIADVDITRLADVHGLADARDGDVQIDLVNNDRRALDVFIVEPLDGLIAAQEHRHGFLPAGVVLGVQIRAVSKLRALHVGIAHADLRGLLRPCGDRSGVGKAVQRAVFRLGGERSRRAEILDELEEFLPRQQLLRAERAVLVAVDDAVQMGLDNILIRRIRKAGERFVRHIDIVAGGLFECVDGQLAHLAARDVLGQIKAVKGRGHQAELVDLVIVCLEPAARVVVRAERGRAHGQKQHGAQQQAQRFSCLSHGLQTPFFRSRTGTAHFRDNSTALYQIMTTITSTIL